MKNQLMKGIVVLSALVSFSAFAAKGSYTCEAKAKEVENQISYAKAHGNTHRVTGLTKALLDIQQYCTNGDLEEDYKEEVQDKLEDVAEREAELAKARIKGDPDKIIKQENKLAEAKAELEKARAELEAFYAELKAK
ncbi:DUF1090 domain-containing protein [Zophobihabitans entericus]|uniref:DUF1090 domain-containing protein n=2 Tax=Zophobihabitans entericus TaxID=1635327 RepID=A0A6G9IDZ3_9GAMM|nr:DUF1090 domain-containing protein [Zophobihabitans entericus]